MWRRGLRSSKFRLRATLAPTSVCEHVNAWLTCGMGGARYLSMRMSKLAPAAADERPSSVQHLRCSAAPVGSTDSTLHCCPPRLRRSCAAAEALATASTWAARRPPHRLYGRPEGPDSAFTVKEVPGGTAVGLPRPTPAAPARSHVAKSFTVRAFALPTGPAQK